MLKKNLLLILVFTLVVAIVTGCSGSGGSASAPDAAATPEPIVLKGGTAVDLSHPYYLGIQKFGEIVAEKTDGLITVEIFHSGQLGSERDLVEGLGMGSVDLTAVSSAPVSNFVPKIAVFDLPYLFTSREHAYSVMDGPVGEQFFEDLTAHHIVGLGWFENGFREITNSKRPINSPADMEGIKIRVMESPVPIATFNAIGANATPMAWGEVFTALQQKTIDAQENPLPVIYSQKLFEVQQYLSLTDHFYSPALFLMSENMFNKLTDEQKVIVREAAAAATEYQREVSKKQAEDFIALCEDEGMIVNTVDKEPFVEAMMPVYAQFEEELGKDLIETILNSK